jgi:hypothetical protein
VIILLLLLGGGLGVYFATRAPEPPPQAAPPPPKNAERSTALSNDTLEIPEEIPEEVPAEPEQPSAPQKKAVRAPAGDPWECAGDLDPKDIRRVLADSQSQIRSCYERRLRNDNMLQGALTLQVRIGNDGNVSATRLRGTLNDKEVRECVQGLAKKWSFPAPTGGNCAVFDAPYNFMPKN